MLKRKIVGADDAERFALRGDAAHEACAETQPHGLRVDAPRRAQSVRAVEERLGLRRVSREYAQRDGAKKED